MVLAGLCLPVERSVKDCFEKVFARASLGARFNHTRTMSFNCPVEIISDAGVRCAGYGFPSQMAPSPSGPSSTPLPQQ
jgi:hypothetical protein